MYKGLLRDNLPPPILVDSFRSGLIENCNCCQIVLVSMGRKREQSQMEQADQVVGWILNKFLTLMSRNRCVAPRPDQMLSVVCLGIYDTAGKPALRGSQSQRRS